MDQLQHSPARDRSPSVTDPNIKPSHSPSPSPAPSFHPNNHAAVNTNNTIVLDLPLDPASQAFHSASVSPAFSTLADFNTAHQSFADQLKATTSGDAVFAQGFINPQQAFGGEDFTIFPSQSADQLAAPLFDPNQQPQQQQQQQQQFNTPDGNSFTMAASQPPHSPTPPHLLPDSAHQSPSFNTHQFGQPVGHHSRHVSLTPEAALTPDWNGLPFQGHRRHGSELSDASSIGGYSPSLAGQDTFSDPLDHVQNSPMLPADESTGDIYQELNAITNFSISNSYSGHQTPAHSPAISPRILPQSSGQEIQSGTSVPGFMLQQPQADQGTYVQYDTQQYINSTAGPAGGEAFPQLPAATAAELSQHMAQMSAPTIEIDFAPNTATSRNMFDGKVIDTDALLPPEQRGRSRRRANTDPYSGGVVPGVGGNVSAQPSADLIPQREATRSLSPMLGSGSAVAGNRRRLSTSAVPSTMALRLAESDYGGAADAGQAGLGGGGSDNGDFSGSSVGGSSGGGGGVGGSGAGAGVSGAGTKRAQKHPANFQCSLCPKRFTRAYNLRSHLRTHTDERPFVCNFCGKAFARQHDRKRHEALHSGEKKFVCKGELKVGGEWGCGRRFARADALGRHFRSEAGRICIKPLLDEEFMDRQRAWQEQQQQHMQAQQNMLMVQQQQQQQQHQQQQQQAMDPNTGYPMDAAGNYALPAALLAQYPALAQMNWTAADMAGGAGGGGMDDDLSGRSSFDASDYDDGDDGGYVSGPGTGFGEGGMGENFGESMGGYSSDLGQ